MIQMSSLGDHYKSEPRRHMVNAAVQVNTIDYDSSKSIRWLWLLNQQIILSQRTKQTDVRRQCGAVSESGQIGSAEIKSNS